MHTFLNTVQYRLCFGLAVEAQRQRNFEAVEQEDASTDTADPDQSMTTQPRKHAPISSAARTTLPSQHAQKVSIDPGVLLLPKELALCMFDEAR